LPVPLADGTLIIDDSYNANPASMRSSIATAAELAAGQRRRLVLVLGEMRELGPRSAREHAALGRSLQSIDNVLVIGIGGDAERIIDEAARAGKSAFFAADDAAAVDPVLAHTRPGDIVLVKGSRGVATEKIVQALAGARGRAAGPRILA
jgi:UDP-N-acetylmuramyl pentapeptide synthase